MCGIFALFLKRPLTDSDISLGRQGTEALAHRGPDAAGEWFDRDAGVYLGHRRLSIIDLTEASDQPTVRDGLALSFNGEIYNYRSLRERLKGLGADFQTTGDTEVLFEAWRHWQTRAVEHVDGMLAFALWDGQHGWLAVDRYGEKPLYYAQTPEGLVISSELVTLVRAVGARPAMSQEQIAGFMALGYIAPPTTAYENIFRIMPATVSRITQGRIEQSHTYWTPPWGEPGKGAVQPVTDKELDRVQEGLIAAVESRLEADAPTCLFLSSGVDSSLIAAIAAKDLNRDLNCFTVSFPRGDTHDEALAAAETAGYLGLSHQVLENADSPDDVPTSYFLDMLGQPSDDLTLASLHQMAKAAAAKGYKVALTGTGGDEITFGYNKHAHFYRLRHLFNAPAWARKLAGFLAAPLSGWSSKAQTLRFSTMVEDCERYVAVKNYPTISGLRELPGFETWCHTQFPASETPIEYQVPHFELESVLAHHRLVSGDVGSMRSSLEARTPFLAPGLQDIVAELDPRILLAHGQKAILRKVLQRYLPEKMVDRPKLGFLFPDDRYLDVFAGQPPIAPLPRRAIDGIWRRREQTGWRSLAVRMAVLSEFQQWQAGELS